MFLTARAADPTLPGLRVATSSTRMPPSGPVGPARERMTIDGEHRTRPPRDPGPGAGVPGALAWPRRSLTPGEAARHRHPRDGGRPGREGPGKGRRGRPEARAPAPAVLV